MPSYCESVLAALWDAGHSVVTCGEGHDFQLPGSPHPIGQDQLNPDHFDMLLELDNGRNKKGELGFREYTSISIPRAVWFVDSHGQPDLHQKLAKEYTHVFFSVWARRDLFAGHASAHWTPNATDPLAFPSIREQICRSGDKPPDFSFGFFGSKGGLERARPLQDIAAKRGWSCDVRQINGPFKPKWPFTAEAMGNCAVLFNHGQKHDGPNLRVMESMAVGRPLITDLDPKSGMDKLFTEGEHYLGYEAYTYGGLESVMAEALKRPDRAAAMAERAYELVMGRHLIKHRVEQMLEVFRATP